MLSFRKGEIVYSDVPYATMVLDDRLKDTCNWCFAYECPDKIKCTACLQASYCSTECRDKDSVYHAFECGLLQTLPEIDTGVPRFALRAVARLLDEQEKGSASVGFFFEHRRTFDDLVSHADRMDLRRLDKYQEMSDDLVQFLSEKCGQNVPMHLVLEVIQKLSFSGHSVHHYDLIENVYLGDVVYLGASKCGHTCEFITDYVQLFDGNRFVLRALEDFSVSDPLEIVINYIPVELSATFRRRHLQERCHITCKCKRCVEESQEPQLPICAALDDFFAKPVTEANMRMMLAWEKRLASFPNKDLFKNKLLIKMFLEGKRTSSERSYFLATSALEGCRNIQDRMKILVQLCQHLDHFGAQDPSHKFHREFKDHHKMAVKMFTDVFGGDHRLTKEVASMNSTGSSDPPRQMKTTELGGKVALEV